MLKECRFQKKACSFEVVDCSRLQASTCCRNAMLFHGATFAFILHALTPLTELCRWWQQCSFSASSLLTRK